MHFILLSLVPTMPLLICWLCASQQYMRKEEKKTKPNQHVDPEATAIPLISI